MQIRINADMLPMYAETLLAEIEDLTKELDQIRSMVFPLAHEIVKLREKEAIAYYTNMVHRIMKNRNVLLKQLYDLQSIYVDQHLEHRL